MPRMCFIEHKTESLNCQVRRDMTSNTKAIFSPLQSWNGEIHAGGGRLPSSPLSVVSFMRGKAESHQLGLYY
jgi:hypothetical protein